MADAYGISRNHLMKIVHELSQRGIIETSRGRASGTWLARAPGTIPVGEIVRFSEPDFAIVECHVEGQESSCAVREACNLKRGLRRALAAFLAELDKMTLEDAVTPPGLASSLLQLDNKGRRMVPIGVARTRHSPATKAFDSHCQTKPASLTPAAVTRARRRVS